MVVGAGALILAGPPKLLFPQPMLETVQGLGVTFGASHVVVRLVGAGEICLAVAWLLAPADPLSNALVLLLGLAFAAVAAYALTAGKDVSCNCFGRSMHRKLGASQVAAIPFWLLATAPGLLGKRPSWATSEPYLLLGYSLVAVNLVLLFQLMRHLLPVVAARRAEARSSILGSLGGVS